VGGERGGGGRQEGGREDRRGGGRREGRRDKWEAGGRQEGRRGEWETGREWGRQEKRRAGSSLFPPIILQRVANLQ
jgi:hypothetical protein